MAKLIQTYNSTIQEVESNSNINLGNIDRSYQAQCLYSFNNVDTISILKSGYYEINVSLIGTDSSEATLDFGIYQNDTLVALAQETLPATTDVTTITLSKIIRVLPNCCVNNTNIPSVIQIRNTSDSAITVNAINVSIKKCV